MSATRQRADEVGAADHLGHRPGDQVEVDHRAADRDHQHEHRDEELHQRRRRQHALGAVGLPDDLLVFGDVAVDDLGALQQPGHLAVDLAEQLDRLAPGGEHGLEAQMAVLGRGAILFPGALLRLGHRFVDRPQHLGDHGVALGVDLGDRLDRLDPAGRGERHRLALIVVLLELGRLLGEAAMQRRAFRQVAPDARVDALELALDDALLGLAAGREQDLAIACGELLLGQPQRVGGKSHGVMDGAGKRKDRPMRRKPGEIHGHREQDEPQQPGGGRAQYEHGHDRASLRCCQILNRDYAD